MEVKKTIIVLVLIGLTLLGMYLGASIGAVNIHHDTFLRFFTGSSTANDQAMWQILVNIRLPRVLAAALVGGSLAVAGAVMQGLFRNPLVDPGIVGVMSGASFAATLFIVLGGLIFPPSIALANDFSLPIAASLGGWLVTMMLYMFARKGGVINVATMLLIGIALGALTGAMTGLLIYMADDNQLRSISFWAMGSLASFDWQKLGILSLVCLFSLPLLLRDARILNALMLGEEIATHLGFDVERAKRRQILLVAIIVGVCVAFSGGIGFVGLVVPHIIRGLLGSNNRYVLPCSFFLGASLLVLSDLVARTVVTPAELPIGILTAMIGAPFLGFLVWRGAR